MYDLLRVIGKVVIKMPFYARSIIFDDIPSEMYNLYLGEFSGVTTDSENTLSQGSSDVTLLTEKLFRRPTPLFYGAEQTPVLSFPLTLYSPNEITAQDYSLISKWLFGSMNYKVLRICQNDMMDMYFNCFLTAPQIVRTGNIIYGVTFTVVCDSPWAWKEPDTYYFDYSASETYAYDNFSIYNASANNFYTYPYIEMSANTFGGSLSIINLTDDSREFLLTISPNEDIEMDCDIQEISSTITTYPLSNFNNNWLRFLPGFNHLLVTGNINYLYIRSPVAAKIGG
jgi:phage-related protein